jgi:hypothetical protein
MYMTHPLIFRNTVLFKSSGIVESKNFFLSILRILLSFCILGEYAESIQRYRRTSLDQAESGMVE